MVPSESALPRAPGNTRSAPFRRPAASRRTSTHRADSGTRCSRPSSFVRRARSRRRRPGPLRPTSPGALRRTAPPSAPGTRTRAWCRSRRRWPSRPPPPAPPARRGSPGGAGLRRRGEAPRRSPRRPGHRRGKHGFGSSAWKRSRRNRLSAAPGGRLAHCSDFP